MRKISKIVAFVLVFLLLFALFAATAISSASLLPDKVFQKLRSWHVLGWASVPFWQRPLVLLGLIGISFLFGILSWRSPKGTSPEPCG